MDRAPPGSRTTRAPKTWRRSRRSRVSTKECARAARPDAGGPGAGGPGAAGPASRRRRRPRSADAVPAATGPTAAARPAIVSVPASGIVAGGSSCGRRRCPSPNVATRLTLPRRPETARARSTPPGDVPGPVRRAATVPGIASENGRAARSAASVQAVSRESRASVDSVAGSATHASGTMPPPPAPSNSFVNQPAPRATAFHATRWGGSPGWYSRSPARSASSLRPWARASAPPLPRGKRRGGGLDRGVRDSRQRKMNIGPAAPEPERIVGRKRHPAEHDPAARRCVDFEVDRQRCAGRHISGRAGATGMDRHCGAGQRAPMQRQHEYDVAAREGFTGGQWRHLDPREVAEGVQQRRRHETGKQKRDADAQGQCVVERGHQHGQDRADQRPAPPRRQDVDARMAQHDRFAIARRHAERALPQAGKPVRVPRCGRRGGHPDGHLVPTGSCRT